jgi:hypothetical protein
MGGKDVENERRSVQDACVKSFIEIPLLSWRQLHVEHDDIAGRVESEFAHLLYFPSANERSRIDPLHRLSHRPDDLQAGSVS